MATALDDLLLEGLRPLGSVAVRRMFGGAGVFIDGLMIGLVSDDELYLKTDGRTQERFQAEGLGPFRYAKKGGQTVVMSYWRAPERLLDDPDELRDWAREALAVARRARATGGADARSRQPAGKLAGRPSRKRVGGSRLKTR